MTKTLWGRVHLKTQAEKFYRCGIEFSREWQKLTDVDAATEQRLKAEQMLEISDAVPNDYVEPVQTDAHGQTVIPVVPIDPAERIAAIKEAIGKLNVDSPELWTKSGLPTVPAISEITGWDVTAAERDAAWAEIKDAQ